MSSGTENRLAHPAKRRCSLSKMRPLRPYKPKSFSHLYSDNCLQSIFLLIQKKIIAARAQRQTAKDIIDTINEYMLSQKFEKKHRLKIAGILERKLNYTRDVKLIDIYPEHNDYKTFFHNSFSLNPDNLSYLVSRAFKKTIDTFRKLEW